MTFNFPSPSSKGTVDIRQLLLQKVENKNSGTLNLNETGKKKEEKDFSITEKTFCKKVRNEEVSQGKDLKTEDLATNHLGTSVVKKSLQMILLGRLADKNGNDISSSSGTPTEVIQGENEENSDGENRARAQSLQFELSDKVIENGNVQDPAISKKISNGEEIGDRTPRPEEVKFPIDENSKKMNPVQGEKADYGCDKNSYLTSYSPGEYPFPTEDRRLFFPSNEPTPRVENMNLPKKPLGSGSDSPGIDYLPEENQENWKNLQSPGSLIIPSPFGKNVIYFASKNGGNVEITKNKFSSVKKSGDGRSDKKNCDDIVTTDEARAMARRMFGLNREESKNVQVYPKQQNLFPNKSTTVVADERDSDGKNLKRGRSQSDSEYEAAIPLGKLLEGKNDSEQETKPEANETVNPRAAESRNPQNLNTLCEKAVDPQVSKLRRERSSEKQSLSSSSTAAGTTCGTNSSSSSSPCHDDILSDVNSSSISSQASSEANKSITSTPLNRFRSSSVDDSDGKNWEVSSNNIFDPSSKKSRAKSAGDLGKRGKTALGKSGGKNLRISTAEDGETSEKKAGGLTGTICGFFTKVFSPRGGEKRPTKDPDDSNFKKYGANGSNSETAYGEIPEDKKKMAY